MKNLVFLVFLFIAGIGHSQKIKLDTVDAEGYRSIRTTTEILSISPELETFFTIFCFSDTTTTLFLGFYPTKYATITDGSRITITMEDKKKIELNHKGKSKILDSGKYNVIYAFMDNKADLALLKKQRPSVISISTLGENYEFLIDEKRKNVIINSLKLLDQTLFR